MSPEWVVVAVAVPATVALKAFGPVVLGGRPLPARVAGMVELMAPALLAALVVTQTFASDRSLVLDPRAAGVGAALVAIALRLPVLAVIVVAAAVAAGVRAL